MITDHRYDAGWPRDDSEGCIYVASKTGKAVTWPCARKEAEHTHSEYPSQRPNREDVPDKSCFTMPDGECVSKHTCMHGPGDMHEPKPRTGELDWPPLDHISLV